MRRKSRAIAASIWSIGKGNPAEEIITQKPDDVYQGGVVILDKLLAYLQQTRLVVLPKSPAARAISYTRKNWSALTRYLEDGDLQIDNNATGRAIRGIAIGRNNWTFPGSDNGGKTAAVLRSFVASCPVIP